jgi:hypothetical protein
MLELVDTSTKEDALLYYTVTEGRARTLDRLNLRDRATYGLDWMVFEATSAADAVRQWNRFKAGNHVRQAELELEASSYRTAVPGYAVPWEAESEAVGLHAASELPAINARREALREEQTELDQTRRTLLRLAKPAAEAAGPAASKRPRRPRAKTPKPTRQRTRNAARPKPAAKRNRKATGSRPSGKRPQRRKRAG